MRSDTISRSSSRSRCCRISTRTGTRRAAAAPGTSQPVELCAGGVAGAYFRICGRTFDRKDPLGRLTYQGSQHLATLGALTDYDRDRDEAERNLPWERWQGRYEWREAALSRIGTAYHHRWFLEQLVTLRDDERTRLAIVTRVALDASGGMSIELKLWPGNPRTVAVRPQSSAFSEDPPLPSIELCESPDEGGVADRAVPDVRAGPAAALDGFRAGATLQAHEARCSAARTSSAARSKKPRRAESHAQRAAAPAARGRIRGQNGVRAYRGRPSGAYVSNRLAGETSPYLLQHADNPVDWYPWGEEAFARARAEGKPVLLSVGYSACHWCHVMAHESFEDPDVAARMNEHFVNIKVDREERPDVDQIYQTAQALMTRRSGGWPLTVFMTPQGDPFFAGTYFPEGRPLRPAGIPRPAAAHRARLSREGRRRSPRRARS